MIDDKKIEEAANKHIDTEYARYNSGKVEDEMICLRVKDSFKEGAKWAINEFIKDLWHTIDENPKKYHKCLVEVVYHRPLYMTDEIDYVTSHITNFGWDESSFKRIDYTIKRWIYIDDLLKGGNHD
jgi:hypothetical protein